MNLGHLAIFHAVAEERSVSRGADRLMISQPAVSKQLAQFERALGARLMDRLPRGIRLTESGEILAGYAKRIFGLESEAEAAIADMRGMKRGRLRIGASTTIGVYLLPEVFVSFRRRFPDIQATLEVVGSAAVENRLINGDLDVSFAEAFSHAPQLRADVFRQEELVAIASASHPLASAKSVTAERFCAEPFIVRSTGSETRSFVEQALERKGLKVTAAMTLGSTEAIKRAVAAGIGVAIVSRQAIELELLAGRLAVVKVRGLRLYRPLYVIQLAHTQPCGAVVAFLEMVKTIAA